MYAPYSGSQARVLWACTHTRAERRHTFHSVATVCHALLTARNDILWQENSDIRRYFYCYTSNTRIGVNLLPCQQHENGKRDFTALPETRGR